VKENKQKQPKDPGFEPEPGQVYKSTLGEGIQLCFG